MGLAEMPVSQIEAIPNKVKVAARLVSVDQYLQLRFKRLESSDMEGENEREWSQILDAVSPVYKSVLEHGGRYDLHDKVGFSLDSFVIISRAILAGTPLQQYLLARQEAIQKAKTQKVELANDLEESIGHDSQLKTATLEVISLDQDLDLTKAVAAAANRSIYK